MLQRLQRALLVGLSSSVLFCSRFVSAQNSAAAQALFDKGLADMRAGKYDTGCPALKESQRIEPLPGTLFTLAECEALAGWYASALAHYEDYLQIFQGMDSQSQQAQKRLGRDMKSLSQKKKIAPLVPYLTVQLSPTAPTGTQVFLDDLILQSASLGLELPVDPGAHKVTVKPPGQPPFGLTVTLKDSERKTLPVEVPVAPPQSSASAGATASASSMLPVASSPGAPSISAVATSVPTPPTWSTAKTGALIAGGVGVVGLIVGGVAGGITIGHRDVILSECSPDFVCNASGFAAANASRTTGIVATVGFGVGLAGLGVGALLWAIAPPSSKAGASPSKAAVTVGVSAQGNEGALGIVRGEW